MIPRTVDYERGCVRLLDQTKLPAQLEVLECREVDQLIDAIRRLVVRGAPAIGVAGAFGAVLALDGQLANGRCDRAQLRVELRALREARPTAVNLGWALDRCERVVQAHPEAVGESLRAALLAEADAIRAEDEQLCLRMAEHGLSLLPDPAVVLTHCNTGALATAGIGTALGVIHLAHTRGRRIEVYADETRPLLQGARLTAWECQRAGIPVQLLVDGAAGWLLRTRRIDAVLIGADRIAANGDTANKIGSYALAVLARRHGVPFYVVAPSSTLDLSLASGAAIPIELREPAEVRRALGCALAPEGVAVFNPAFDVTPAELISAIVTEQGVFWPPFALRSPAGAA
jgi:methylthioribose-1-phosphate isomerase